MFGDYLALAFGNLRHRGIRSWLTMLGVFIGIAAVVSLISLGQGLQEAVIGQFSTLSADRLVVENAGTGFGPPGSTSVQKLTEHDLNIIQDVTGVERALSRIIRIVRVEFNDEQEFIFVGNLPETQEDTDYFYDSFSLEVEEGRLLNADESGKVLLGHDFIDEEEFGKRIRPGTVLTIQGEKLEVVGILKEASSFQFNSALFMTEDDMKEVLDLGDEIDLIVVQVEDEDQVETVAAEIARKLRKDRDQKVGEEDFSVQTPLQAIGTIQTVLNVINLVVAGIAAISLLVGGIGITNTMYTSVLERTKEIGTMKAIGAKNKDILLVFLIESGFLGLAGGLIGAALGMALAFGVAGIANASFGETILKVQVSYPLIGAAIAFAAVIGIVTGLIPAIQASRLKPVEALRS